MPAACRRPRRLSASGSRTCPPPAWPSRATPPPSARGRAGSGPIPSRCDRELRTDRLDANAMRSLPKAESTLHEHAHALCLGLLYAHRHMILVKPKGIPPWFAEAARRRLIRQSRRRGCRISFVACTTTLAVTRFPRRASCERPLRASRDAVALQACPPPARLSGERADQQLGHGPSPTSAVDGPRRRLRISQTRSACQLSAGPALGAVTSAALRSSLL
jgi:hypothetical protein